MSEFDPKQKNTSNESSELVPQIETAVSQANEDADESQKLSTIRNILLGGQIKQYDSRFSELEQRFEAIKNNVFDQTTNTLTGLEQKVSKEFETLTKQIADQVGTEFETYTQKLDTEKKERYASIEKFVSRLDQLETVVKSQLNDIKNQIQGIDATIQQKVSEQIGGIKEDIQNEFDTLSANIQEKINQQTQRKIERTELAGFFKDMADRFNI
jgi:predicted  nucleic acid-binding Zn-ribbon protein